jgi:hypothetical protein
MSAPAIPQNDLYQRVVAHVREAAKPVSLSELKKKFQNEKAGAEVVSAVIESAVEAGQIYGWPGRSRCYWNVPWDRTARDAVLAVAATKALSKTDLGKAAARKLPGIAGTRVESIVAALMSEKQLEKVVPFSGRTKLLIRPGDSQAYFSAARAFIEEKFRKANLDPTPFFNENSQAPVKLPTPTEAAALLFQAVRSLEPVKGVPVSTLRLRHHLPRLSKNEFDAAALELRKNQQVFLSQHVDPYNISQEEKELLIDGQDGTYYVAIAIR